MPTDHPDGETPIVLSRADIKTPIDYQKQTVGVYQQPEWAALTGIDKNFEVPETLLADGEYASMDYTVPAGKTLYLTHHSAAIWGDAQADKEKPQIVEAHIDIGGPPWTYYGVAGGNGGVVQAFTKPVVVDAGETAWLVIYNRAGHSVRVWGSCCGYEI